MKKYLSYLLILIAGCLWGISGLFTRVLTAGGLSPASIVLVRNVGGVLLLTVVFLATDRSLFRVSPRDLPWFFGTGVVAMLLNALCNFSSQQLNSLAAAATLLSTSPVYVVLLSALIWRDRITGRKLAAMALAFLGCLFVSGAWSGGLTTTPLGLLLGLGSGFFYGLYSIFGRFVLSRCRPFTVTYYSFLFAAGGALLLCLRPGELAAGLAAPGVPLAAAGLVVIPTVLPYLLYTRGLAEVDSGKAAILVGIEPVAAAVAGILAFHEPMTPGIAGGMLCVMLAVYLLR